MNTTKVWALGCLSMMMIGCAVETGNPGEIGSAGAELRDPRICPAVTILCPEGRVARQLPNCRQVCVPDHGEPECRTDEDCTIYCITFPCPSGECVGRQCRVREPSGCAATLCPPGTVCEEHGRHVECVPAECPKGQTMNPETGLCECTAIGLCITGYTWDPVTCQCISPCDSVRCEAGTHCEVIGNAVACVPDAEPEDCRRTGCSGQICADTDVFTTCEWRPEYACYADATCERQPGGECGFTPTPELAACLAEAGDGGGGGGEPVPL